MPLNSGATGAGEVWVGSTGSAATPDEQAEANRQAAKSVKTGLNSFMVIVLAKRREATGLARPTPTRRTAAVGERRPRRPMRRRGDAVRRRGVGGMPRSEE